jgi:hypothetical protein
MAVSEHLETFWAGAKGTFCMLRDKTQIAGNARPVYEQDRVSFQNRVKVWLEQCFGKEAVNDKFERNSRFIEEALELVQSLGLSMEHVLVLVDYVYNRPVGEPTQEVGGTMTTLAALCNANDFDMEECGDTELVRMWDKIELIRHKRANKPSNSPLPQ